MPNYGNVKLPPSLLVEIAKVLAAPIGGGGGGNNAPAPDKWNDYSNVFAAPGSSYAAASGPAKKTITVDPRQFAQLDPKTQAKLNSLYNIKASMGDKSGVGGIPGVGGILHEGLQGSLSVLNRVGDVLSRGEYAVAEPVRREFNDRVQGKSFGSSVKDMGSGFWAGLSGKKKTYWSNVIQDMFDVSKGADKGLTAQQAVKQATDNPGSLRKAPGWARWGIGLPADILFDPANAVGVGEINKVVHAPEYLKAAGVLHEAAGSGAKLGATAKVADALKTLTDEEKARVADTVMSEMKKQGKDFEIGIQGDKKGLVTRLMRQKNPDGTPKFKTGDAAYRKAQEIVNKNLKIHGIETQKRLLSLARDRAFEHATPEELRSKLETHLGLHADPTTGGKWVKATRQFRATMNPMQKASQLRRVNEAIRNITEAEHDYGRMALRDKYAKSEADLIPLHSEQDILNAKKAYETSPQRRYEAHGEMHDTVAEEKMLRRRAHDSMAGVEDPELAKYAKDTVDTEFAKNPHLAHSVNQVIAVHGGFGREGFERAIGLAHQRSYGKYVRFNADDLTRENLAHLTKIAGAHPNWWAAPAHTEKDLVRQLIHHELGHQYHYMLNGQQFREVENEFEKELVKRGLKPGDYGYIEKFDKEGNSHWVYNDETAKVIKEHLSEYAATNHYEAVAEAIASVRHGGGHVPTDLAKWLAKRVDEKATESHVLNRDRQIRQAMSQGKSADYEKHLRDFNRKAEEINRRRVKNIVTKVPKSEEKALLKAKEERQLQLAAHAHTIMNPEVQRKLGIHLRGSGTRTLIGPKHTGMILPLPVSGKAVAAGSAIARSDNWFNNTFRASTGVPPEVMQKARAEMGAAQVRIEEQNKALRNTWGKVGLGTRKRAIEAWVQGRQGVKDGAGNELTPSISADLHSIQQHIEDKLDPRIILGELDRTLPRQLKFHENGIHSIWTDSSRTTLKKTWLEDSLREIVGKHLTGGASHYFHDPAAIIASVRAAAEHAVGMRVMRADFATTLAHPATQVMRKGKLVDDELTQALKDRGYKQAKVQLYKHGRETVPIDLRGQLFAPEVADGLRRVYKILNNDKYINDAVQSYDKALRVWKGGVTKFNPGYHERNLFGEVFTSWLGGVKDPRVYSRAMRVLWKHDRRFLDPARAEKTNRRAMRAANALMNDPAEAARHLSETGQVTSKPVIWFHGRPLHEDEIWHLFTQKAGLHSGFIASDLTSPVGSGRFGKLGYALGRVNEGATTTAEGIEDYTRLAHFIDALGKSKSRNLDEAVAEAAGEVRKFHHDFNDFTHFETAVMARLVPFYKWTRKNLPLMAETLFTQPGKADKLFTVPAGVSYGMGFQADPQGSGMPLADPLVPSFLQNDRAVPVGHLGKNTEYVDSPLPLLDALKMASSPIQSSAFMLNPALKTLIEEAAQHQIGGKQITSQKQYFAGMSPYSNLVQHQTQPQGKLASILQFLSGIGLQENTQKRMLSEAIREQQAAAAKRKKYYKSKGFGQSP